MELIMRLARDKANGRQVITRLDIQFNYILQEYRGTLWLSNGECYTITANGRVLKLDEED